MVPVRADYCTEPTGDGVRVITRSEGSSRVDLCRGRLTSSKEGVSCSRPATKGLAYHVQIRTLIVFFDPGTPRSGLLGAVIGCLYLFT